MKNALLLCTAALLSTTFNAQLQLSTPEPGEFTTVGLGGYITIPEDVGTTGQAWDFSGIAVSQSASFGFLNVDSIDFGESFASAEIALELGDSKFYYSYDDAFRYFGEVENQLVISFTDPEEYFPLPFNVGDNWEDTFASTFGAAGITFEREGTVSSSCLAQGSVTVPGGQVFEDAYRVNMIEYWMDSTFLGTYEVFAEADYWFVEDYPRPVFGNVSQTTFDTTVGGEPIVEESSFSVWMESYTVGLETVDQVPSWSIMPNPARDEVTILRGNFQSPVECVVYGLDGREMMRELIRPGMQMRRLDVSQLAAGVFMVQLGKNQQVQRLVIQR